MQKLQEMQVLSLGQEDPLDEGMATHSNNLIWKIPWTEEPGGLLSTGLQRVRHDLATKHQQCVSGNTFGLIPVPEVCTLLVVSELAQISVEDG